MSELVELDPSHGPSRPEKLTVDFYEEPDGVAIHKKRGGGPGFFLLLWLIGWTVGCVALVAHVIHEPSLKEFAFAVPFLASWLFVAGLLVWILFGKETLVLRRDAALFRRMALVNISSRNVPRAEIRHFRECRSDHTENDEHLWGIEMVTLGKPLRFAFHLPDRERLWLIHQLNSFLSTTGSDVEQSAPQPIAAAAPDKVSLEKVSRDKVSPNKSPAPNKVLAPNKVAGKNPPSVQTAAASEILKYEQALAEDVRHGPAATILRFFGC